VGSVPVASVVGRLRPEVVVVDVDVEGERGHAAAEAVAAWCVREGLWHLVRPSGGAEGRSHVFIAHGGRLEAVAEMVEQLRASMRVGARRRIDLRRDVRPLSAPHRASGVVPRPYGDVTSVLARLCALPWAVGFVDGLVWWTRRLGWSAGSPPWCSPARCSPSLSSLLCK
jgi:hypothetical protein